MQLVLTGCIERKAKCGFSSDISRDYPVYGIRSIPDNLYMLQSEGTEEKTLLSMLFCGLVKADDKGDIIPSLAESWTVDKDSTTYTFRLRDNLYWSDGIAINSEDFLNFFRQIFKPGFNNKNYELSCIAGLQGYNQGKNNFSSVGINAKDGKTLIIKLNHPCSYFLNILSQPEYALKRIDTPSEDWTKSIKNIVSSGPFLLDSINKDSEGKRNITLLKNEKYWDKDKTVSKKIVVVEEKDCESAMADYETGKIDLFISPPESEIKRLLEEKEAYIYNFSSDSYIFFNLKKEGPASDANFRKAVNYMISRKDLIDKNAETVSSVKNSFFTGSSSGYFSNTDNGEYAEKLMQKVKNADNLKLIFIYEREDPAKKIYENLVSMLKKKLHCKAELIGLSRNDLEARMKKGDFDMVLMKVDYSSKSDISVLDKLIYSQKQFPTFYYNQEFSLMLSVLKGERNSYKKTEALKQCEKKLFADMPFIPICSSKLVICRNSCITGLNVMNNGCIDFQALYILKAKNK